MNEAHVGVMVVYDRVVPSERPPFWVRAIVMKTYSFTARSALFGSTRTAPPSPPNGDTICGAPGFKRLVPLSCMPPQIASPPAGEAPMPAK